MKSILLKSIMLLAFSAGIIQTSSANWGHCYRHYGGLHYYGPRVIPGPRAYYGPAWVPGHWGIDRWGYRVWIRPHYM